MNLTGWVTGGKKSGTYPGQVKSGCHLPILTKFPGNNQNNTLKIHDKRLRVRSIFLHTEKFPSGYRQGAMNEIFDKCDLQAEITQKM
jgi:hypothetical protein